MFNSLKGHLFIVLLACLLYSCGDNGVPQENSAESATETTMVQHPVEVSHKPVVDNVEVETTGIVTLTSQIVYQKEIYKNWPYTEAPSANESIEAVVTEAAVVPVVAANAQTHTINAEARLFRSDTLYINSGDIVAWINMTSHNTVSVEGLIPEAATPWAGKLGQNLKIKLDVEGIYAYVCQPHIGFGMVGLIIVGKPTDLEEVKAYAMDNLKGPFRRIIGKLNKIKIP